VSLDPNLSAILVAGGILAALGLGLGIALAFADRFFKVEEDPRLEGVERLLPGSNCGACGQPGCRGLAEKIVAGAEPPSRCTVSSPAGLEAIAELLGVDVGAAERRVARVLCGGGLGRARRSARYQGFASCSAAHLVGGGGLDCSWGCLGLADCVAACEFDALRLNGRELPVVDVERCTACGDCVEACPRDLFQLLPRTQRLIVQCRAPLAAEAARRLCSAACDACGRCVADAPPGLLRMVDNLPVLATADPAAADPRATYRCPTGAIRWVSAAQFGEDEAPASARRAHA
jgi:Na+-translocating ferredoxin:NAD+ oxidoreductase RNF subunit RnfB